jgi:flagellar basal-body rod modification protein FlgD
MPVNSATAAAPAATLPTTTNQAGSEDRFLKLLVAQMQNQDPLNPLDNAQVTSQMAQINTVSGIEKLNRTVETLGTSFAQMQALQGASLVGRGVLVQGDRFAADEQGAPQGGFDLNAAADSVRVEVLSPAGLVVDTIDLGAQGSGRHAFTWTPPSGTAMTGEERFRIVARSGATAVAATPLMHDRVEAVSLAGDTLTLELSRSGPQPYSAIKAFN